MSAATILTAGFVLCALAMIVGIARRDAPTAAAGMLGALVLGILAILRAERDRYRDS
jgi:hypothetical protein